MPARRPLLQSREAMRLGTRLEQGRISLPDRNIDIVERIFEGLNSGDLGILDELVDPGLIDPAARGPPA
jgi:hypothetical protein